MGKSPENNNGKFGITQRADADAKLEEQRVTFLRCVNASESLKMKPLVIRKSKNRRSFKNATKSTKI